MTDSARQSLLQQLPDIPRWVETRSMLLADRCDLYGDVPNTVVKDRVLPLISVHGKPDERILRQVISESAMPVDILVPPENQEYVQRLIPEWTCNTALLHLLKSGRAERLLVDGSVRQIDPHTELPDTLPKSLWDEFSNVADWLILAAKFVDNTPVSFCCAPSITEKLWDVSIDTLESHRQKGYAEECVEYMIALMRKRGREPVWGALESNIASIRLAKKLGFQQVDRLAVFTTGDLRL